MNIMNIPIAPAAVADAASIEALLNRLPEATGIRLSLKPTDDGKFLLVATIPSGLSLTVPCADIDAATEYLTFAGGQGVALLHTMESKPGTPDTAEGRPEIYGAGFMAALALRAAISAEAKRMAG